MGCGTTFIKIIFCIFNTLVMLAGIAIAVLGGIFRWGSDALQADAEKAFSEIEAGGYAIQDAFKALSLALFIAGIVIFFIAMLGLLGACCKWRALLIFYVILVILIIILEIVPAIIFFVVEGTFEKAFNEGMKKNIEKANNGDQDFQSSIEYLMKQYQCCKAGDARLNNNRPPEVCTIASQHYSTECYQAIKDKITQNGVALAAISISIIFVEVLCVIFAICLFRSQRKEMVV